MKKSYIWLYSFIARIDRKFKQRGESTVKSGVEAKVLYISKPISPRALHCRLVQMSEYVILIQFSMVKTEVSHTDIQSVLLMLRYIPIWSSFMAIKILLLH